jgi:hypothetical protein
LSSAILYLAIVAIWACVLVPRWLHRSHESSADLETSSEEDADYAETFDPEGLADWDTADADATEFATLREQDAETYADPVAWENPSPPAGWVAPEDAAAGDSEELTSSEGSAYSESSPYSDGSAHSEESPSPEARAYTGKPVYFEYEEATYSETVTYSVASARSDASAEPAAHYDNDPPAQGQPWSEADSAPRDSRRPHSDATMAPHDPGHQHDPGHPQASTHQGGPSLSRAHVVQARRRLLTMLVTLTIATLGAIFIGLLPGWIILPPVGMLVLYLFLLREAAHADAENAFHRAEAHARAAEAQAAHEARERARLAQDVPELQPTAEIIDISALAAQAGDQLYDQYADAEVRAVGD